MTNELFFFSIEGWTFIRRHVHNSEVSKCNIHAVELYENEIRIKLTMQFNSKSSVIITRKVSFESDKLNWLAHWRKEQEEWKKYIEQLRARLTGNKWALCVDISIKIPLKIVGNVMRMSRLAITWKYFSCSFAYMCFFVCVRALMHLLTGHTAQV